MYQSSLQPYTYDSCCCCCCSVRTIIISSAAVVGIVCAIVFVFIKKGFNPFPISIF
jgi:hypothetical protein